MLLRLLYMYLDLNKDLVTGERELREGDTWSLSDVAEGVCARLDRELHMWQRGCEVELLAHRTYGGQRAESEKRKWLLVGHYTLLTMPRGISGHGHQQLLHPREIETEAWPYCTSCSGSVVE